MVDRIQDTDKCTRRELNILWHLKGNQAFKELNPLQLEGIAKTFSLKRFPESHAIIKQDHKLSHVFLILKGVAVLVIRDHQGHEHICNRLSSGHFIVDNAIFAGHPAINSIFSIEPLECLVQHQSDFILMLKNYPVLKDYFYKIPIFNVWRYYQTLFGLNRNISPGLSKLEQIPPNIKKTLAIIDRCFAEPLTLENLADKSGTSRYYFSRLFKKYTGYSFRIYLNKRRVMAAKYLMKEKGLNVSESCFRVGYNDLSYFSKIFKKFEGIPPSVFKKKLKK